ncbi:MAG: NAD+ synthase [Candidatus Omnitrophica bacterium]|nr:NAD+ synthase [Candidatus Omnitrophota bacterium]
MLKIALAQINAIVGDLEANKRKIIAGIERARREKFDVIVFPELAITGYPPEDLLLKNHFVQENLKCLKLIAKACKDLVAIVGFADSFAGRIYNACAIIQNGKVCGVYRKMYLPSYSVFDEARYFNAGGTLTVCKLGKYNFALSICEDIWKEDFIRSFKGKNIDFILNISASPFYLGKVYLRQQALSLAARKTGAFIFYCNLVGGQDELVFDGTSTVVNPKGELVAIGKRFEEDFLAFSVGEKITHKVQKVSSRADEECYRALCLGLSDYVKKNGFGKVIIGISGGIDSALVLALAVHSLGRENVFGLIMPSRYTSAETLSDAKKVCDNFNVKYYLVSIEEIFASFLSSLAPEFAGKAPDKTEENLQARIRGALLMAFSNKFGYLVLNTGNKSEVSCGYCTLYGDMVGGFGVLKDLSKDLVYKLSRYINEIQGREVLPYSIIERAPSAELKPNQKDSDSLPEYKLLDPILKLYIEEDCSLEKIVAQGYSRDLVKRVINMVDVSEYKRRQGPIGIKITPRAFGKDRRMPITNRFSQ